MRAYLIKRFLLIPVTLLGITLITFVVMQLAPGDPSQSLRQQASGGNVRATTANREAIEQWRRERHLDEPLLNQYGYWVWDLVRFDLGQTTMPPRQKVSKRIFGEISRKDGRLHIEFGAVWITIILNTIAFGLMYLVAIPIGIVGGARQFSLFDRISTVVVFLLYSLPGFWIGTLMIAFLTGPNHWWAHLVGLQFPTSGYYPEPIKNVGFLTWLWEWVRHLTLPVLCETYAGFAFLSRQMRSSLLEQVRQDFVRTARAKGLAERVVILRHATHNALIPIITLFGTLLPELIAGSIIIEYLFSIPGMGQLFFEAVLERDYNVVMGIEAVSALLTLFGILVSDLLYLWVNPTISYE